MSGSFLRPALGILVSALALTGCGSDTTGRNGQEEQTVKVTPADALASLSPDAKAAVQAAMPGREIDEQSKGDTDCGGPDVLDGKNASKIIKGSDIEAVGDPSDGRPLTDVVAMAAAHLKSKGWEIDPRQRAAGDVTQTFKKAALAGAVHIKASSFRLASGKAVPILTATVLTDCLPNPGYQKG